MSLMELVPTVRQYAEMSLTETGKLADTDWPTFVWIDRISGKNKLPENNGNND